MYPIVLGQRQMKLTGTDEDDWSEYSVSQDFVVYADPVTTVLVKSVPVMI